MGCFSDAMSGGTGQFLKDPTATQLTGMQSLVKDHPALAGADFGLDSFMSGVQSHMAAELGAMAQRLPLMSAHDGLSKMTGLADGTMPGAEGGDLFKTAMSSLTAVPDMMSSLYTKIENLLASAPPAPTQPADPLAPPVANPTADTIKGWLQEASGQMASLQAAAAGAASSAIGQLQSFGFTSFLSGEHPPAVKEILGKFADVPPELKTEKDLMAAAAPNLQGSAAPVTYTLPTSDTVAKPKVPDKPKPMDPAKMSALKAEVDRTKAAVDAAKITYDQSLAACQAWQDSHNYAEVKRKWRNSSDKADADAWHALKAQYEEEVYNHHLWEHANYGLARDDYFKACDNYQAAIGVAYTG